MRKRIIELTDTAPSVITPWIDIENVATVEVTSEDPRFPVEGALTLHETYARGWRAATPGRQLIRVQFDQPERVRRIEIAFRDEHARTQEFLLAWSDDNGLMYREIVRQQWNFGPEAAEQVEEYDVDLRDVTTLALDITPDIRGEHATATLARLRVA